jgi:hypothetical protein
MSLLIGAMTIGFILSLLALGVFISFASSAFRTSRPTDQHGGGGGRPR